VSRYHEYPLPTHGHPRNTGTIRILGQRRVLCQSRCSNSSVGNITRPSPCTFRSVTSPRSLPMNETMGSQLQLNRDFMINLRFGIRPRVQSCECKVRRITAFHGFMNRIKTAAAAPNIRGIKRSEKLRSVTPNGQ
jgi:hypothetical protein